MENRLAENIHSYRKAMGLTQEQLAERLGITLGAVSKWERGSSEPDLSYIMELAELFHVSVDALIGFTMHGNDADAEADRLEALGRDGGGEKSNDLAACLKMAEEFESALRRFPNHFRIVCDAALVHEQIGVVFRRDGELERALELFRHAINLLPQNRDRPEINEARLRNEIAGCYSALKNYGKAIEEYKKNNQTGRNDAIIGCLYTLYEKKPEEGIRYTESAFSSHFIDMITTMVGYIEYYIVTARPEQGIRAAEWTIRFLESLKADPARPAYVDKILGLIHLALAFFRDAGGDREASEESLAEAVRIAAAFDAHPVSTMENMVLLREPEKQGVYDDSGPTAMEGLISKMEDIGPYVPDGFRERLEREMERAAGGGAASAT